MGKNIQDIYPLSPMQKGMLFHSLYSPESEVYKEQICCRIIGKIDINIFKESWSQIVNRHDILRTAFIWEELDEPLQIVKQRVELPFELNDWSNDEVTDHSEMINVELRKSLEKKFDFAKAPLMRFKLIKLKDDEHFFILDHHHILFDGWGFPILFNELLSIFNSLSNNEIPNLPTTFPFKNYIAWIVNQDLELAKLFWQKHLENFTIPTLFRLAYNNKNKDYTSSKFNFSRELTDKIEDFIKVEKITLNTFFQGVWSLLLSYYLQQKDIVFGSTVSGRNANIPGIEQMVGLFINTLPVRAKINFENKATDWLKDLQNTNSTLQLYEFTPLFDIHNWSDIPNDQEMFNTILIFQNYPIGEQLSQNSNNLQIKDFKSFEKTNYPLTLVISPNKILSFEIAFSNEYFSTENIEDIFKRFKLISELLIYSNNKKLSELSLLDKDEFKLITENLSLGKSRKNKFENIVDWFDNVVSKYPNKVAVEHNNKKITFSGLNIKANRIAELLLSKDINRENIVIICLDKSIEMVISLLGVIKAGALYLPLESDYPDERVKYILKDSKAKFIITSKNNKKEIFNSHDVIFYEDESFNLIDNNLFNKTNIDSQNGVYVIYTSGSTGKPKGVIIEHKGLVNTIQNMIDDFNISSNDNILQFSSFNFDGSVGEIFLSLLSGAKLVLVDREVALSADDLMKFIRENEISFASLPPSYLSILNPEKIKNKLTIISVGDKCSIDLAKKYKDNVKFLNGYGPTETTIAAAWHEILEVNNYYRTTPIGKPLANVKIYILDENLKPLSKNILGEIYIGGESIGRAYLNNPELTAEKFIPNPFSINFGERLYKTGDLAIFTSEGKIEIIGRKDFQVKIRGNRIELTEIENVMLEQEDVKECLVTATKNTNGNESLTAFLIPNSKNFNEENFRAKLKSSLPTFMIPSQFILLDKFPLNSSGKIDRDKLTVYQNDIADEQKKEYLNLNEEIIKNIWSYILKIESINKDSNFFHLGGHSLTATQLLSRLRETYQKDFPLELIFSNPTLKDMAKAIERYESRFDLQKYQIIKADRNTEIPLSYSQQRLWFLDKLKPNNPQYNIPTVLRIEGELDINKFYEAANYLIVKHEILRTIFIDLDGKPVQNILSEVKIDLPVIDISLHEEITKKQELNEFINNDIFRPFQLDSAPLFRMRIIKLNEKTNVLILVVHHIISDGWSMNIMIRDFLNFYNDLINNKIIEITQLEFQYADYALWQKKMMETDLYHSQLAYWKKQLLDIPSIIELPYDKPRPSIQTSKGDSVNFEIDSNLTEKLQEICQSENSTLFMILLAAFNILLHKYTNQNDIIIGTPIAGREIKEVENIIGFFVNNLALRIKLSGYGSIHQLLQSVRKTTLEAYSNQSVPFDKLVEELQPERSLSHQPIFQVIFVFQNLQFDEMNIGDLKIFPENINRLTTAFDLSVTLQEVDNKILGSFEYNTDLFFKNSIIRMIENYKIILNQLVQDVNRTVNNLVMIPESEKELILKKWNHSNLEFNIDELIHERFEKSAQINFNNPALVFATDSNDTFTSLIYSELNKKANQLANYISETCPGVENIISICMDRSLEMIINILAILKSGNAFLSIDPSLPIDRIHYMIKDSNSKLLIIHKKYLNFLSQIDTRIICYEDIDISNLSDINLNKKIDLNNLAYVIYTSGSTGKPKGVMLTHKGLTNLSIFQRDTFNITNKSRVFQFSSSSFDASVWEMVMALTNGGRLYLTSKETILSGNELTKYFNKAEITTVTLPPSVLASLPETSLPKLKTLITAGELVSGNLVEKWSNGREFFNAYGPTETTVCATIYHIPKTFSQAPPIGKAINNFETYILDSNFLPVGIGIPGELCIGGIGLARGYLNNSALTAEKFIPNFYANKPGERLYRSGDLARFLSDGNIEFLGRIDTQVKIRGFRIEINEIENNLKKIENILDAVVTSHKKSDNNFILVAYIVSKSKVDAEQIKLALREKLPEYMIPSLFVQIDKIPLTISGKINKNLLPKPEYDRYIFGKEFVPPVTETQKKLAEIISSLLEIEEVGIKDNFFELGGHSLLATQFISRINKIFEIELQLTKIFEAPTIEGLAEIIDQMIITGNSHPIKSIQKISREDRKKKRSEI